MALLSLSSATRTAVAWTHPTTAFLCRRGALSRPGQLLPSSGSTSRLFSAKPDFDSEMSRLYKIISENHRHPSGPWVTMLEKVHQYVDATSNANFKALDLATGPGEPAETIARQFPDCTVVATDVSPDQVKIAEATTATLPNMAVQLADMQDLSAFGDSSFDLVTCCYGFMFPPDIPRAVAESYRVLKPGGKLIATTWNRVGMMEKLRSIMTEVLGQAPPPPPVNPLSLADPGRFEGMLTAAGYESVETAVHEYPFDFTKDPETQFQASIMLVKEKLDEMNAWDKAREAYEKVRHDHGSYDHKGHWIVVGNEYKLTVATKPLQ